MSGAPPPSSFDDNLDFFEESRWQKLRRRIIEEPLIPLGCALTCWALYEATRSIRSGDKHRTNRMFRRRIYAQGFTILAMLGGSAYWETDRVKRRQYDDLLEEKKRKEKHEQWIKELEVRDAEEAEFRELRKKMLQGDSQARAGLAEKRAAEERQIAEQDATKSIRSVLEESDSRRSRGVAGLALEALGGRWR